MGTIPAVAIGLLFKDYFDSISKSGLTIGWEFLATGLLLWFGDSVKMAIKMDHISYGDAFLSARFKQLRYSLLYLDLV